MPWTESLDWLLYGEHDTQIRRRARVLRICMDWSMVSTELWEFRGFLQFRSPVGDHNGKLTSDPYLEVQISARVTIRAPDTHARMTWLATYRFPVPHYPTLQSAHCRIGQDLQEPRFRRCSREMTFDNLL